MKEYMGNAINVSLVEVDGKKRLKALAEVIVLVSEPVFEADAAGQMIRRRKMDQFRFGLTIESALAFIGHLEEYVDEMQSLEGRYVASGDTPRSELDTIKHSKQQEI